MEFLDIFNIYLPIAEIEFNALLLIVIGFCVGVLGGFFGVGGGWIVTPALNIFGFPMPYAIGTDLTYICGSSMIATKKHSGMGNVDWKLGIISIIGAIIGLEVGAQLIMYLEATFGEAGVNSVVRISFIILLFGLGAFMFYDYFVLQKKSEEGSDKEPQPGDKGKPGALKGTSGKPRQTLPQKLQNLNIPPMITFKTSGIRVSFWIVFLLFFVAGLLSGFLGVGGGFIKMPAMVYLLGIPTVIAIGTDLLNVLFSAVYGCFTYSLKGRVEFYAALFMFAGAAVGSQFGAAATRYIRGYGIRLLFAIMVLLAGSSVVIKELERPLDAPFLNDISGVLVVGSAIILTSIIVIKLTSGFIKMKKNELDFDPNSNKSDH